VILLCPLDFVQFRSQFDMRGKDSSQPDEGPDDKDIHLDRAFAAQNGRQHRDAMFGDSGRRPTQDL